MKSWYPLHAKPELSFLSRNFCRWWWWGVTHPTVFNEGIHRRHATSICRNQISMNLWSSWGPSIRMQRVNGNLPGSRLSQPAAALFVEICHFCHNMLKYVIFVANVTKILTYTQWENKWENELECKESMATYPGCHNLRQPASRAARKWRGRERTSSLISLFLLQNIKNCHFLSEKMLKYVTFVTKC